jgi:Ca2+-dependent lipid-binding protein
MVPSRVSAKFDFEIHDWDRVGTPDLLGGGKIDLAALEPFESIEKSFTVVHDKKGEHGTLTIRMMFQPESKCRVEHG